MPTGVWPVAAFVGEFMVKLALIGYILLRRPARPASNLAWITVILAIPVLGVIAYLFVGEVRLSRRRIGRHAEIRARLQGSAPVHRAERPAVDGRFHSIATLAEAVGDNVPVAGNTLQLISETALFIDALVSDIDAARSHCHLVFYIFLDDHTQASREPARPKPVKISSAISSAPCARHSCARPGRNPDGGKTSPPRPSAGSTITAPIRWPSDPERSRSTWSRASEASPAPSAG